MSVEEFAELVKVIPQVQQSITRYESRDTGVAFSSFKVNLPVPNFDCFLLPSPPSHDPAPMNHQVELIEELPPFPTPPTTLPDITPLIEPELNKILDNLRGKGNGKKRNRAGEEENRTTTNTKKMKTDLKKKKQKRADVKQQCTDEVATVEAMKEVEQKLWLEHYDQLCEQFLVVVREKCDGCQTEQANQLGHELCLMASIEEQVDVCFDEAYNRVKWNNVLDRWYEKLLKLPVVLNPETLSIFRDTIDREDVTYKSRLKKWLIESPTIEL